MSKTEEWADDYLARLKAGRQNYANRFEKLGYTTRNQRYEIGHDAGLDVAAAIIRDSGK